MEQLFGAGISPVRLTPKDCRPAVIINVWHMGIERPYLQAATTSPNHHNKMSLVVKLRGDLPQQTRSLVSCFILMRKAQESLSLGKTAYCYGGGIRENSNIGCFRALKGL
jgi:hypothetical protein